MLNLTKFCLRIERHSPDRLRLLVTTAPGLAESLRPFLARYGARVQAGNTLVFQQPEKIAALFAELTDEAELVEAVREYAGLWKNTKRGKRVGEELTAARIAVVDRIVAGMKTET